MEDMSDYVLSPHDGVLSQDNEAGVSGITKVSSEATFIFLEIIRKKVYRTGPVIKNRYP